MPRPVKEYSDMLMERIEKYGSNVYLVNTGMDHKGHRFALPFTRMCIKDAMDTELPDNSEEILDKLLTLLSE
jgi:phosphoenolpyruvate carboxykinase (ATP)